MGQKEDLSGNNGKTRSNQSLPGRKNSYFPINFITNKITGKSNKKQIRLENPKWFLNEIIFSEIFPEVASSSVAIRWSSIIMT